MSDGSPGMTYEELDKDLVHRWRATMAPNDCYQGGNRVDITSPRCFLCGSDAEGTCHVYNFIGGYRPNNIPRDLMRLWWTERQRALGARGG